MAVKYERYIKQSSKENRIINNRLIKIVDYSINLLESENEIRVNKSTKKNHHLEWTEDNSDSFFKEEDPDKEGYCDEYTDVK